MTHAGARYSPIDNDIHQDSCDHNPSLPELISTFNPPLSTANWLFNSPRTPSTKAIQGHLR
ncbi:hypothetical protein PGT21_001474 [Puccinia graminis f. sp. tritici]|uniref:Uncharacterized protein n=1 Tax=Puccinia graminis f. sp. tritici TaxID=56615 RepID=A0A5B0Q4F4_PUCGR|nr:hypothetical protein PGT21_001474 [Puccinia graminis f. sp. tritici]